MKDKLELPRPDEELKLKALNVKRAAIKLCQATNSERKAALDCMADSLKDNSKNILDANKYDYENAEKKVKAAGLCRMQGKNYEMQNGDIVFFKFNN